MVLLLEITISATFKFQQTVYSIPDVQTAPHLLPTRKNTNKLPIYLPDVYEIGYTYRVGSNSILRLLLTNKY